jgi:phospholipid transport system substrate-binding protein
VSAARGLRASGLALALLLLCPPPAPAQSPTDTLRQYTDEVLRVFQETALREDDTLAGVRAAVRKVMIEMFGLAEAARAVLGEHWQRLGEGERREFTQLFADLLEATYLAQMDRRGGVRIRYTGEAVEDARATVSLLVLGRGRDDLRVVVVLLRDAERWRIYDVVIDGVSVIANYRAQFDRVIRRSSYADFVQAVRARRDTLLAQRRAPRD